MMQRQEEEQSWDDAALVDSWNEALKEYKVWPAPVTHLAPSDARLAGTEISQHPRKRR